MNIHNLQLQKSGTIDFQSVDQSTSKSTKSQLRDSIGDLPVPSNPLKVRAEKQKELAKPSVGLRGFSAVMVGIGTVGRALLAVGTLGISEGIKALADKIGDSIGTKNNSGGTIKIVVPGTGETMNLNRSALPKRIGKNISETRLQQIVQQKVDAGHALVSALTKGEHGDGQCTVKDMTNIMFFLQVKAEAREGSFPEGAFNIADPGHRIANFLDSCPQSYQRESSHITDIQKQPGCAHRGIDAYGNGREGGFDHLLPHGMKTLLYGKIPENHKDGPPMPEDRLYLKIESHGAWLTRAKGGDDEAGPHRTGNHHDIGAILGHSLSFINSRGKGSAAGTFKERIPNDVKNGYNNAAKNVQSALVKNILSLGNPTASASGIRVMLTNVNMALDAVSDDIYPHDREQLTNLKNQLLEYSHPELRIGNEIIFTEHDMTH